MRLPQLFRSVPFKQVFQCRSVATSCLEETSKEENLLQFLPSNDFLKSSVRKPSHRAKLTLLVAELQLFAEMFGRTSIPNFTDSMWSVFFQLYTPSDRCDYLASILKNLNVTHESTVTENAPKISEINAERYSRGEMVYAPDFHSIWELRGKHFRSVLDKMYGARLLSLRNMAEALPEMIVDCRFLRDLSFGTQSNFSGQIQDLYNGNWTSRRPFNIKIANYQPDSQLSAITKRDWLFHYGPSSSTEKCVPHPFSPSITPRGLRDVAQCDPSRIMYISWRATRFLPPVPPPDTSAVVLCASNDYQPWSSSVSAAKLDAIPAFRIPVEQYVRLDGKRKVLSMRNSASVLRAYFSGDDIGQAIRDAYHQSPSSKKAMLAEEKNKIEAFRLAVEEISRARKQSEEAEGRPRGPWRGGNKKAPMQHRYSRDERRLRREQESTQSPGDLMYKL